MTNPSPTLARIQAEHPSLCPKCLGGDPGACEDFDCEVGGLALAAEVTDLDRQIADLKAENARLKQELENARAQALADRAFQSENARLREQLAEADENMIAILADQTWSADIYHAALARQEQRRNNPINPNRES